MRVIGSVEVAGVEYEAVWGSLSSLSDDVAGSDPRQALAVRTGDGRSEAIIPRNARLADVERAIRQLRSLGLKDSHLYPLFNYKGKATGLAQHVKVLVSNLT